MSQSNQVEALEGRRLFSGGVAGSVKVIGESGGVYAAAVTPTIKSVTTPEADSLTNARRDLTVVVAVNTPNGAVRFDRLYRDAFRIYAIDANGDRVGGAVPTGNLQTSGGGDTLSVTPTDPLAANTTYRVEINQSYVANSLKVRDIANNNYAPYQFTFKTGTAISIADPTINFSQQLVASGSEAATYSAVTMGPDGRLYASTLDGFIYRWTVAGDGTLSGRQTITTVRDNDSADGARIITGITFDPDATSGSLKLWVSHGQYKFGSSAGTGSGPEFQADNYTGKISVLSGASLQSYNDVIVGIPRSVKDHINNQIGFDPAGNNFFFLIPSMNAMGAPDNTWGNRPEDALSGAMMKVNIAKLNTELIGGPIDLTSATYNATNTANALNIYATGIRNAYDMVFHSNGRLYTGVNGSSAGGNTPAGGGAPALTNVPQTEQDKLLDLMPGKYYGHPNPTRGEYVLDGGNPTSGPDPYEFAGGTMYPVGTQPDADYTLPAYDLGKNVSPNGMIEYTGAAFGGKLNGTLLIARYNSGQDILAITPNGDGSISKSKVQARITGLAGLQNPLDLTQNNGNLYVAQLDQTNNTGSIVLMKPKAVDAVAATETDNPVQYRSSMYVAPGNRKGVAKVVHVRNDGTTTLVIDVARTKINGAFRKNFGVLNLGTENISILPGESHSFTVRAVLARGDGGPRNANLAFATNQPGTPYTSIQLRAFNVFGNTAASTRAIPPAATLATGDAFSKIAVTNAFSSTSPNEDAPWWLEDVIGSPR